MCSRGATKGDGGFAVSMKRIDGEELGLFLSYGQAEELSGALKGINEALEAFRRVADDSHVVCIEEDL